jgi:putative methyltransferase
MNFYFEAAKILDKVDKRQGSIKGVLSSVPEKDRKRMSALVIESLKCTSTAITGLFVALI